MGIEQKQTKVSEQSDIIQDGVACPRTPPWPKGIMKWTTFSMMPNTILAIYILSQTNVIKLVVWFIILILFCYPLRYLVCARCPYYGKNCSTYFGRIIPFLFKKQEGKSMKLGLWLDLVIYMILFVIPLPEVWQFGGIFTLALYFGTLLFMSIIISRLGCANCPLTFCPIGQVSRRIWQ